LFGGQLADGAKRLLNSQEGKNRNGVLAELDAIAKARGTTRSTIALAWLLKHSSKIVPIIGSADPARIRAAVKADSLD
jgi:predicted oxidoreductase